MSTTELVFGTQYYRPPFPAPPAPGCAPARPALHVSTLLFAASANHSCALGAEALAHQLLLFLHLHRFWTCGAGSRRSASLPVASASANHAFSAWPKTLKTQDSQPLSKYLPRKVIPISPGRLVPGAYSEGSLRVAQAQPDFPTIRRSKNAPARLTRILHTPCIPVRHA